MELLLNSMMYAAVSINVASTMSLESFALNLPTINVAFKYGDLVKDHNLMWSFDMYHTSEHYRAIVDNDSVALAKSMDDLIAQTIDALDRPETPDQGDAQDARAESRLLRRHLGATLRRGAVGRNREQESAGYRR